MEQYQQKNTTPSLIFSLSAMLVALNTIFSLVVFPTPLIGTGSTMNFSLVGNVLTGMLIGGWLAKKCSEKEEIIAGFSITGASVLLQSFVFAMMGRPVFLCFLAAFSILGTWSALRKKYVYSCIWIGAEISFMYDWTRSWNLANETNHMITLFLLPQIIAIVCAVILIYSKHRDKLFKYFAPVFGTVSEFAMLNLIAIGVWKLTPPVLNLIIAPVAMVERLLTVIISLVIYLPLIRALKKAGV